MAAERDLEKSEAVNLGNIIFDESGYFVLYTTMLGIKVVNLYTNRCVKIIGKPENLRPLKLALYQVSVNIFYMLCSLCIQPTHRVTCIFKYEQILTLLCFWYFHNENLKKCAC